MTDRNDAFPYQHGHGPREDQRDAHTLADQSPERRLRDIHIRPIRESDWHKLQLFHRRLSAVTIARRFHGAKQELSEPLAHYFTRLDGHDDVALVATTGTRGRIIGVARYYRIDEISAEVAFVIEDRYQHQGVGKRLMRQLREVAVENGITQLVAEVLPGNDPMLHLLREAGPTEVRLQGGECEVRVKLTRG